ncbi:nuclear transport factor 2 family protein [Kitasatospora arboriphila]
MVESSGHARVAERFLAAFGARDDAGLRALLAEDVVWSMPGSGTISGTVHGRDAAATRAWEIAGRGVRTELLHVLVGLARRRPLAPQHRRRRRRPRTRRTPRHRPHRAGRRDHRDRQLPLGRRRHERLLRPPNAGQPRGPGVSRTRQEHRSRTAQLPPARRPGGAPRAPGSTT